MKKENDLQYDLNRLIFIYNKITLKKKENICKDNETREMLYLKIIRPDESFASIYTDKILFNYEFLVYICILIRDGEDTGDTSSRNKYSIYCSPAIRRRMIEIQWQ